MENNGLSTPPRPPRRTTPPPIERKIQHKKRVIRVEQLCDRLIAISLKQ